MRGTANFLASLRVFKIHFLQPVLISELVDNGDVGPEGLAFPALGRDHPKVKAQLRNAAAFDQVIVGSRHMRKARRARCS